MDGRRIDCRGAPMRWCFWISGLNCEKVAGAECRGYDGHETTDRTEEINNAPSGPPMRGAAFDS